MRHFRFVFWKPLRSGNDVHQTKNVIRAFLSHAVGEPCQDGTWEQDHGMSVVFERPCSLSYGSNGFVWVFSVLQGERLEPKRCRFLLVDLLRRSSMLVYSCEHWVPHAIVFF